MLQVAVSKGARKIPAWVTRDPDHNRWGDTTHTKTRRFSTQQYYSSAHVSLVY
jgi:hypothetical protein